MGEIVPFQKDQKEQNVELVEVVLWENHGITALVQLPRYLLESIKLQAKASGADYRDYLTTLAHPPVFSEATLTTLPPLAVLQIG